MQYFFGDFNFDLYGNAYCSLARDFLLTHAYTCRRLGDLSPTARRVVAMLPWHHLLPLLQEGLCVQDSIMPVALILPMWRAQPWWPLLMRFPSARVVRLPGLPWKSAANRPGKWAAIALFLGPLRQWSHCLQRARTLGCHPVGTFQL